MLADGLNEFFSSALTSGSQERQDKLREMGFVDILHKLTQASDPNLSDRWATIANHKTQNILIRCMMLLSRVDSFCISARAKTAMQQYLAWPQRGEVLCCQPNDSCFFWFLFRLISRLLLLHKDTFSGPVAGLPSPPTSHPIPPPQPSLSSFALSKPHLGHRGCWEING